MRKTKNQRFVDTLAAGLVELGAKEYNTIESCRSFKLDTVVGNIDINIYKDVKHCYTMFTCFDNVNKAKTKFDCNPYSGKYNTHIGNTLDMTPEKAAEICLLVIEGTLPIKITFSEITVEKFRNMSNISDNIENHKLGFLISLNTDNNDLEVQKIDDPENFAEEMDYDFKIPKLIDDDSAKLLAKKMGYLFSDNKNSYKITGNKISL